MAKVNNKKPVATVLLVVLILAIGIGYAAFGDTLNIVGTATANGKFDIEFSSATVVSSVGVTSATAEPSADKNTLNVSVSDLKYPGAGVQFQAVITNAGTAPAKISSVNPVNITGDGNAIKITGLDAISTSHPVIQPNGTCTINFTVEWDSTVDTLNDTVNGDSCDFSLEINYSQDTTTNFSGTADHVDTNPTT